MTDKEPFLVSGVPLSSGDSSENRVLIIGLDGAAPELLVPWAQEGELPNLHRLMDEGCYGEMQSTIPPISGPAWSSVITGRSPGMTGLYDFLSRKAGTYHFVPINSRMRDGRSFWQMLGDWGKRVGVLNVPVTYPVEPVNGFMVSGWMTPYHARDFTYPRDLAEELGRELGDYRLYPAATYSERRREAFFEEMDVVLRARIQATSYLMSTRSWDFFISVIYETDLMEHQLWHYIDPTHPRYDADEVARYGNPLLRFFQGVDRGIGQFVEQAGEDVTVIVMSDHGMGAVHRFVFLNCWLLDEGFLQLKRDPATWAKSLALKSGLDLVRVHRLADWLNLSKDAEYKVMYTQDRLLKMAFLSFNNVDWSRSVAYSYGRGIGPIYLNVRGREPHGIVEPGEEYQRIRQEIAQRALAYRHPDTGEPMVREVLWPEAIYHGDHVQEAPDLILVPARRPITSMASPTSGHPSCTCRPTATRPSTGGTPSSACGGPISSAGRASIPPRWKISPPPFSMPWTCPFRQTSRDGLSWRRSNPSM